MSRFENYSKLQNRGVKMSFKDTKQKRKAEKRKRRQKERRAEANKRRATRRLNPMVRRALNQVGLAEWGTGLLGKRYQITGPTESASWLVKHYSGKREKAGETAFGNTVTETYRVYECYSVSLHFDGYGNAIHFSAPYIGKTNDTSEKSLRELLEKAIASGPNELES